MPTCPKVARVDTPHSGVLYSGLAWAVSVQLFMLDWPQRCPTAWDRVSGLFNLASWSGASTNWWLWVPIALRVYKRWKGAGGTHDEVRCDLTLSPTSPSDRSLRCSGGRNPPHHFGSPALTGSGVVRPLPDPTSHGSTSTSPIRTSTPAPTMSSSSDKSSGETR
jgi:hypothetical protein